MTPAPNPFEAPTDEPWADPRPWHVQLAELVIVSVLGTPVVLFLLYALFVWEDPICQGCP